MSNWCNKKKIHFILLIFVCLLYIFSKYNNIKLQNHNQNLQSNIKKLDIDNQKFQTEINQNKEKVTFQNQVILTQKAAIEKGKIEVEKLKNIKSKVSFVTNTQKDTIFITYSNTISDTSFLNQDKHYKNLFQYQDNAGWFSLSGYATELGVGIDSLKIKNEFSVYIADKKINFFRKSQPQVILLNKNPYTETIKMNNIVIKVDEPFYQRNVFWAGVGFFGGFVLRKR